jgi:hypothetical protein
MITKQQYVEYLICTIGNYTSSNLAEHLDNVSHDVITDYLSNEPHTARGLWELVIELIEDGPGAFLLVDDSVQDKRYSRFIELVKLQYSGAEHGLVRGIGVVNLVHSAGAEKDFYPIDYRIYAPDQDGKTKNDHFAEMVIQCGFCQENQGQAHLVRQLVCFCRELETGSPSGFGLFHNTEKQSDGQFEQRRWLDTSGRN